MSKRSDPGQHFAGVALIDKPAGMTSFDVVRQVGRVLGTRTVGHCGTLDPDATGVMVVCAGWATRLVPYLTADDKAYDGWIRFGYETVSDDAASAPTFESGRLVAANLAALQTLANTLLGTTQQIPPAVSAIHIDGKRAHERVRAGEVLAMPPREVVVHQFELSELLPDRVAFWAHVGKGTYIRSLARDLGRLEGSLAHLMSLRRTRSGPFELSQCQPLRVWQELDTASAWAALLRPWDALAEFPAIEGLDGASLRMLAQGKCPTILAPPWCSVSPKLARVADESGELFGLVRVTRTDADSATLTVERLRPQQSQSN
jgi:tRNA pseudouridine55 synthase